MRLCIVLLLHALVPPRFRGIYLYIVITDDITIMSIVILLYRQLINDLIGAMKKSSDGAIEILKKLGNFEDLLKDMKTKTDAVQDNIS